MSTKLTKATIRIMNSYKFGNFESTLTIENDEGIQSIEIDELLMQAQSHVNDAVDAYKALEIIEPEKPYVKTGFKPNKQVINVTEQDDEPPLKDNASIDEIANLPLYTPKK